MHLDFVASSYKIHRDARWGHSWCFPRTTPARRNHRLCNCQDNNKCLDSNLQSGAMENLLAKHSGWRKLKNLNHDRFQKWEGQGKVWKPDGNGIDGNNAAQGYLDVCHSCCYGDTKTGGLCHLMMPGKKITHKTQKMRSAIRFSTCINWEMKDIGYRALWRQPKDALHSLQGQSYHSSKQRTLKLHELHFLWCDLVRLSGWKSPAQILVHPFPLSGFRGLGLFFELHQIQPFYLN